MRAFTHHMANKDTSDTFDLQLEQTSVNFEEQRKRGGPYGQRVFFWYRCKAHPKATLNNPRTGIPRRFLKEALDEAFEGCPIQVVVDVGLVHDEPTFRIHLSVVEVVSGPKSIPSTEEALEGIHGLFRDKGTTLDKVIEAALQDAYREVSARDLQRQRVNQVQNLTHHVLQIAAARARKETRLSQRLAALYAEAHEEMTLLAPQILSEELNPTKDPCWDGDDGQPIDPVVVATVHASFRDNLRTYIATKPLRPTLPGNSHDVLEVDTKLFDDPLLVERVRRTFKD